MIQICGVIVLVVSGVAVLYLGIRFILKKMFEDSD